ncbi:nucleoside diphosphate kinase Ndk1 [Basidiobolus ranarum]|uniref:Nucleoside diphosphate kinase n=1 Tax=Basidiobolus ranarum TaxID=34480 RepID=A0ABR2X0R3_9FUNG
MFARTAATFMRAGSQSLRTAAPKARAFTTQAAPRTAAKASTLFGLVAAATAGTAYWTSNSVVFAESSPAGAKGTASERTFIAIKPDGVQRSLIGEIIKRFESRGYKLVGMKLLVPGKDLAEEHYADLKTKPFFKGLVDYMTNGKAPVVAMVWEGQDVIKQGRSIIGATNPLESAPGTIRGDLCISVGRNIIHGSDSFESAEKEIGLWFKENEIVSWTPAIAEWIFSAN